MSFERDDDYGMTTSKPGDDTALHGCAAPKQKVEMVLSKHELATRISEQDERHARTSSTAGCYCKREGVDLSQIKRHIVIEFEFEALAGAFEDAFEQVAAYGKHPSIFVHELRVALLSTFKLQVRWTREDDQ